IVARKDGPAASEATSSPKPIQTITHVDPNKANPSGAAAATAESREDRSPLASPHDSATYSFHN
ncbi:hypothetical protein Tco_0616720, partial [Tanacetum coccineum]